ncbi:MAG: hypothetical protein KGY40_02765 [Thioalkalivibrio sp.]|jgi:high-affinity Fe2+/Pb2+ permease|nr:hypothetical protein [Thioalkalivibrio sp.]
MTQTSPALLAVLLGILLFLSPLVPWVAHLGPAWWWPFAAWGALIAIVALFSRRERHDP